MIVLALALFVQSDTEIWDQPYQPEPGPIP